MTFVFQNNYTPTTGADVIFTFKQFLVSQMGWTVMQSSDGTSVYNGDGINSANPGLNGMANDRAWFIIQMNGTSRMFSFQHVNTPPTNNRAWRIKYSFAGFDTPNHINPQLATPHSSSGDDQVVFGGGTDDFPTFNSLFKIDGTYTLQIAGDTSNNGVFFFCHTTENLTPSSGFVFDPLAAGSYDPSDVDPYMIYISGNTTNTFGIFDMNDNNALFCPRGWLAKGLPNQGFVNIPALVLNSSDIGNIVPSNIGSNAYAAEDQFFPIVYARPTISPPAPPYGYKGVSSFMQWCAAKRPLVSVIGLTSPGDHVIVNSIILPWNNSALIT